MLSVLTQAAADYIGSGLAAGGAAIGAGIGIGFVGLGAAQAVGRNPGAFGPVLTISLICMALAEAIAIFGLIFVLTGMDK